MAGQGEPEGTVVTACTQLKGRGRLGRVWWDKPGESALLSVILRPPIKPEDLHQLAFVTGLGVAEWLIAESCPEVILKWPNDVLLRGRKVAGILVEADLSSADLSAVVGIGVNVNQREFPADLADTATSVFIETGITRDIDAAVERIATEVMAAYGLYLDQGFKEILDRWRNYMWGAGAEVEVTLAGEVLVGRIAGVDPSGALVLTDARGKTQAVRAADSMNPVTVRRTSLNNPMR